MHMSIHMEKNSQKCNESEKAFSHLLFLIQQAPTHPDEKPLEFDHYGKFFRKKLSPYLYKIFQGREMLQI